MTKAASGTVYKEFIPSHGNMGKRGWTEAKQRKQISKPPLLPYLPTHYLPPPGALTKIQGVVHPGLT